MNIEEIAIFIKQHKAKIASFMIGLFFIPLFVVHLIFKWKSPYDFISAEWTAGDLIGYIASFEAFIGTIILGAIAVWQNDKANKTNDSLLSLTKESERRAVLPYLSFNSYLPSYEGSSLGYMISKGIESRKNNDEEDFVPIGDNIERKDFLITELNYIISYNQIEISDSLSKEQKEKIKSEFGIEKRQNGMALVPPDYRYDKIQVMNSGKGTVVNLKCRLYKVGSEEDDKQDVYSIPFTISEKGHFDLGIYFDHSKKVIGSYRLVFMYQDIYMNKYQQTIPLEIVGEAYTIDFYQPQEQIEHT